MNAMKRLLSIVLALLFACTGIAHADDPPVPAVLTQSAGLSAEAWMADDTMAAMGAALLLCDLSLAGEYEVYDVAFNCIFARGTAWLVRSGERFGILAVDESREALILFDPASGTAVCRLQDGGAGIEAAGLVAHVGLERGEWDEIRPLDPYLTLTALVQVVDTLATRAGIVGK